MTNERKSLVVAGNGMVVHLVRHGLPQGLPGRGPARVRARDEGRGVIATEPPPHPLGLVGTTRVGL